MVRAVMLSITVLISFSSLAAQQTPPKSENKVYDTDGTCTPPGEREYYKEWLLTESQSLLHKCALGGLINFNVLALFDPRQALLDFISGQACNFVRQKTQPFRDDLNREIDRINGQIDAFNRAQDVNTWLEPNKDKFNRHQTALDAITPGDIAGSNFVGQDLLSNEITGGDMFNGGAGTDANGNIKADPVAPFVPSNQTQTSEPVSNGLLKNTGKNGVERFPMPKPAQWGDIYRGIVQ